MRIFLINEDGTNKKIYFLSSFEATDSRAKGPVWIIVIYIRWKLFNRAFELCFFLVFYCGLNGQFHF